MFSQSRAYDPASNVISHSTTQAAVPGSSGSGGSESQNFCYDEQNRLVWAGTGTCGTVTLSNSLSGASYNNVAQSAAIKGNQVFGPYGNARDAQGSINTFSKASPGSTPIA